MNTPQHTTRRSSLVLTSSVVLFLLLFLSSCQRELIYSCDSSIDSWVRKNKAQIATFDRAEIATYTHNYQKAILSTFSPEKKKELWQEKVNHILTLDLPKEEIAYLKWYAEVFKSFDYTKTTPKEIEKEMYKKTIEAMEQFGWNRKFIYQTFFIVGNVDLDSKTIVNEKQDTPPMIHCDCMYAIGCPGGLWTSCDKSFGCDSVNNDCGFFGGSECTGFCD